MTHSPEAARPAWLVLREGRTPRWGGEIRRHHIFTRLAERTRATLLEDGWSDRGIRRATLGAVAARMPLVLGRHMQAGPRPRFAASEKLRESTLAAAIALTDPTVVAVYDDPIAQAAAVGLRLDPGWQSRLEARQRKNVDAFRWQVAPTRSFAELAGLDLGRVIIGGNGTNTSAIRPGPWPDEPTVGIVSAAAPGRGLELLMTAVELAREEVPGLRLVMWLVATTDEATAYLGRLSAMAANDSLTEVTTAAYADLGRELARASVMCIAHPPNDYMDVALPVKLFDSLAAGRPLVVTPRTETLKIVKERGVGIVANGDKAEDLATAIVALIGDEGELRRMGARARHAAETTFDWSVVGDRIADEILRREQPASAP